MCQGISFINPRMTPLSSKHKSCPKSSNKFGLKCSTTLTPLSIFSNLIKWSSSPWTVSLHDQKWTIKEPEDSKAPETTNNSSKDSTDTTSKVPTVNKTSKTIQFPQVQSSCNNWTKWFTFSSRKRLKKTITGKISVSFLQGPTALVKVSIKSWNGSEQININSHPTTVIVFMEPMPILSC